MPAGVDMDMASGAYRRQLVELVRDRTVDEAVLDEAVRHILRVKIMLGLFDRPYADETLAEQILLGDHHRAAALEVAQRSMGVLKDAGGVLPLSAAVGRRAQMDP